MQYDILTLFPEFFDTPLKQSILGRAVKDGHVEVATHNIRDYATDKHSRTDDAPYGGGAGMVMKVEPIVAAIEAVKGPENDNGDDTGVITILVTPQGRPLTQPLVEELSTKKRLLIVCGRYEGFDERIRNFVDMEISVGDYILSGGEIAALTIIDTVSRLLPGVIEGNSLIEESFTGETLEYPHYTRPEEFRGMKVPEILLSGNHGEIEKWRKGKRLERTLSRRPELIK